MAVLVSDSFIPQTFPYSYEGAISLVRTHTRISPPWRLVVIAASEYSSFASLLLAYGLDRLIQINNTSNTNEIEWDLIERGLNPLQASDDAPKIKPPDQIVCNPTLRIPMHLRTALSRWLG